MKLEDLLKNLGDTLHLALTNQDAARTQIFASNVVTVVNGQLGPYLHGLAKEIEDLKTRVGQLTGGS